MDELLNKVWLVPFLLARVLVFMRVLPFMGSNVMPQALLTAFAFSLAPLIFPIFGEQLPATPPGVVRGVALVIKEMLLGFVFAFCAGLIFWAVMSVGFLFDNQRGASQGDVQDPLSQEMTSPFGALLFQWTTLLFCGSGALVFFLGAFVESYVLWPVFALSPPADMIVLYDFFLRQTNMFFRVTIVLAAPVLAVYFLSDFSLGLVNRFAQQLNVYTLAMPVKSGLLLGLMLLYLSILQHVLLGDLLDLPDIFIQFKDVWYGQ